MADQKENYGARAEELLNRRDYGGLRNYLRERSNLPGPRANLELADQFGRVFDGRAVSGEEWAFLTELSQDASPANDPGEILPFCAVHAFAVSFPSQEEGRRKEVLGHVLDAMRDGRWRMREAAAAACGILGLKEPETLLAWLEEISDDPDLLVKRGIVAGLADPQLLKDESIAKRAIVFCDRILSETASLGPEAYRTEAFRVLRQGLNYAPSVLAAARPLEGFDMLRRYAAGNRQIRAIIKENVKKNRLVKPFPRQVLEIMDLLEVDAGKKQ